ncbi:exoribonuclease II [Novimethylophilus kurashikiensis]|uniref:Exoribonuclease II n=1 Tax=Novimethylophilus kurashikiensis TaxID=1825523 RepID=A0A2R5FFP4_9PROT|nr:RNB domain-containing ribonuclease [Novimethylophilus kurashikiensis]GBG15171.1 exoribonuclease II [Novimethylophilus kurashikiensis]
MNVFYEEEGSFKIGSVMTENPGSLQVEALHGKRSKIKSANVLLKFENPLAGFMEQAQSGADDIDVDFLWECCGEPEFGFEELAKDYFGHAPNPVEAASVAIRLHSAPMYFYRKGKGRYKAAPEDNLKAALAAQERKRIQAEKVAEYVEQIKAHKLPAEFGDKLDMLIYEPDKNTLEWKALDEASIETGMSHIKLLETCGAIASAHDYHFGAFLREHFPGGIAFPSHGSVVVPDDLPQADVDAFSIDDSTTTEIDDAFSILALENGNTRVGIHIAAPSLGILPGSELDAIALQRLSTVYMPGNKITMLPEPAIEPFSLLAGHWRPALSLYLEVAPDFSIVDNQSRVEMVKIAENLRHDTLEPHFNEETLTEHSGHEYWERLSSLHQLAESLEKARGKYDPNRLPQVDYNFYVEDGKVRITERKRGSPMDKLVAELMIYANAHWGGLLAQNGIPGIYRAQTGGKVFMTTEAEPHQGLGVAQYAWSTSPLRRAVDLINQRQMIALLQGTEPAYAKGNEALTTAMRDFDFAYNIYNDFQQRMERYWCLQYLIQENVQEVNATVWRENLVRLDGIPYMTKVHSLPELAAGERVRLKVEKVDPLMMDLYCKFQGKIEV